MVEISPQDLLPENFTKFKDAIPGLKISARLYKYNPLKYILQWIENNKAGGIISKAFILLALTYLTMIVALAFYGNHPSAPVLAMSLLPVYGVAFLSWHKSPLSTFCLAQLISKKQANYIINKAILPEEKAKNLKDFVNQIATDRAIILISLFLFIISYYLLAFLLADIGYDNRSYAKDFVADLTLSGSDFSARVFKNFLMISAILINIIAYSGNIFIPYENAAISEYLDSQITNKLKKYIYYPLKKAIWYLFLLLISILLLGAPFRLYAEITPFYGVVLVAFFFWGLAIAFNLLLIFSVCMLRLMALLLNKLLSLLHALIKILHHRR